MIYDIQKADMWKRISALILDLILLAVLASGFAFGISDATGYDTYYDDMSHQIEEIEKKYGLSYEITEDEFYAMDEASQNEYAKLVEEVDSNSEIKRNYNMMLSLTIMNVSLSVLFSYIVLEFALPVFFKNGQTIGKKVFGLGVVRIDGVRVNNITIAIRTILGKYAIETMIPLLILMMILFNAIGIVGPAVVGAIGVVQVFSFFASGQNRVIHDLISQTMVADLNSTRIFETIEERNKYIESVDAERAERESY